MSKKVIVAVSATVLILLIAGVVAFAPTVSLEVPSTATHRFVIDAPMPRVRKILVRTNAIKKIVAMADATMLDQKWLQLEFEMDRPILKRDWQLDGEGELVVRTNDDYIGSHDITLNQTIEIAPDKLHSFSVLAEPIGPIREYRTTLTLTPDLKGRAKIESSLQMKIKTTAGWLTSGIVKGQIEAAAEKALLQQEQVIRDIVDQHADELIILPGSKDGSNDE